MDRRCPWPTWLSLTGPDPIRFDEHGAATQRNVSGALSSRVLCDPAHHCFHMRRGTVTWGLGGVYSAGRPIMGATVACVHVCMCVSSEPLLLVCMYVTHARDVSSHGTKYACTSPTPFPPAQSLPLPPLSHPWPAIGRMRRQGPCIRASCVIQSQRRRWRGPAAYACIAWYVLNLCGMCHALLRACVVHATCSGLLFNEV